MALQWSTLDAHMCACVYVCVSIGAGVGAGVGVGVCVCVGGREGGRVRALVCVCVCACESCMKRHCDGDLLPCKNNADPFSNWRLCGSGQFARQLECARLPCLASEDRSSKCG